MDASSAPSEAPRLDLLGDAIRTRRHDLGLSQTQLAQRIGWSQERISILETGKYGLPSVTSLTHLAVALEVPLVTLIAATGLAPDGLDLGPSTDARPGTTPALLLTVHQLMGIEMVDLKDALNQASTILAGVMGADKIDAFLLEPSTATLVAVGSSATPMAETQRRLGLDRLPLANQTREVEVYETGRSYRSGCLEDDPQMAPGVINGMGAHSMLAVLLTVGGERRGVLSALSAQHDRFREDDVPFLEIAARWVGMVAHRAELVDEIARTAAEAARHAAVEEIATAVAHDLTNHMTVLKPRLDRLRQKLERAEPASAMKDVTLAAAVVMRMEQLIGELRDTSRLEEGIFSLVMEEVDLCELVRTVVRRFETDDTPIYIAVSESLMLQADRSQIERVLDNVVSNACRHSPDGITVIVEEATCAREDARWAQVIVADQGPGIPADLLPTIFHRFASGPGSTGLGLGLYLARSIAEAHGGTLTVDSSPGVGACFTLSLPMRQP